MTAEEKVAKLAADYPSLFGTNGHALTKALAQMFLTLGGGYKWHDGELKDIEELRGIAGDSRDDPPRGMTPAQHRRMRERMVAEENDRPPHLPPNFDSEYLKLANMPADVKPDWRRLGEEVLRYFLTASKWCFPKWEGIRCVFSDQQEWDAKAALRKVEAGLAARFPDWPAVPDQNPFAGGE